MGKKTVARRKTKIFIAIDLDLLNWINKLVERGSFGTVSIAVIAPTYFEAENMEGLT